MIREIGRWNQCGIHGCDVDLHQQMPNGGIVLMQAEHVQQLFEDKHTDLPPDFDPYQEYYVFYKCHDKSHVKSSITFENGNFIITSKPMKSRKNILHSPHSEVIVFENL